MSLCKFESEVKYLSSNVNMVFDRLNDLRNLETLKERLNDPAVAERMSAHIPADKMEEAKKQLESLTFDKDSLEMSTPVGQLKLRIIEREEPKCVKFASEGSPIPLYLWIQLLPHGEQESKMKVTVGAEVNMFMKGMVSKPLQQAADGLANILAHAL